jgi:hypothetical protein
MPIELIELSGNLCNTATGSATVDAHCHVHCVHVTNFGTSPTQLPVLALLL